MKKLLIILIISLTSSAIAQLPSYVPTNGLIGWWPFNGNANDESGNGIHGINNGASLVMDRNGVLNSAYEFNGSSWIECGFNNLLNVGSGSFSLGCWALKQGSNPFQHFITRNQVSSYPNALNSYAFRYEFTGLGFYSSSSTSLGTSNGNVSTSAIPNLSAWNHFVAVFNTSNNTISIYVNGILNTSTPITTIPQSYNLTSGLYFGVEHPTVTLPSGPQFLTGKLDDIGIWNRALTPTEITNLYNSVNTPAPTVSVSPASTTICPGTPTTLTASTSGSTACSSSGLPTSLQTGLVGYWPFCGNANDASGNGNNGTVNGATLTTDRFGNSGSAYSFDGVDDFISTAYQGIQGIQNRTVSFYTKMTSIPSTNDYAAISYGGNTTSCSQAGQDVELGFFNYNGISTRFDGTCTAQYTNNTIDLNWHHVTFIINSSNGNTISTIQIYIDGVLQSTSAYNGSTQINSGNLASLVFGKSNKAPRFFNGKLDDIAIWNRALTAAEIQQLYTTSNATYSWSPGGATTQSITVSPTATTTYTVTATANGQSSTSTAVVTVSTPPTITASSSSICAGQSATLTAAAAGSSTTSPCSGLTGSLSSGLVGYWPFCGNANDVSGNGNNGNVIGATLTSDRFGITNSAYQFNGSNQYINLGSLNSLGANPQTVSYSFWMSVSDYPSGVNAYPIFSRRHQDGLGYDWCTARIESDGKLKFFKDDDFYVGTPTQTPALTFNVWSHITLIKDGDLLSLYQDGQFIGSITDTHVLAGSPGNFYIGLQGAWNLFFKGKLDDFGIWNRALTTAEIQQLYTQGQTTYSWSPGGATTSSITVSPTSTITYSCSVTTNGTTCSSDQVITVNPIPSVNAGLDQSVCTGSNVTLSATGATTYAWSGGVQNGVAFAPTSSGTYTVTGTSNGCSATDIVQVNVVPAAVVSSNPAAICIGQSSTLTATVNGASSSCSTLSGSLSTGLVGYWPFCGNANDVSGNGNNGTVNGAILTTDRFGNLSSAYSFDGVNDYIETQNITFGGQQSYSISVWFNLNTAYAVGYPQHYIVWNGSTLSPVYINVDNDQIQIPCSQIQNPTSINAWHNIIISKFNNVLNLYLDGNIISSSNCTNVLSNNYPLRFGSTSLNTEYTNGKIDDIGIWNRALTTAEIQQLYTQGQTTYSWSPGGATTPSITVSPTSTTTYTYTATTNGVSCPASATVTVNPLPVASISPAGPVNLCQGQSVTLCAPNTPGLTYLWCNASTTSCITTNFAGNYCLVVTDANGCTSNSVSTIVNVAPLPTANAGTDFTKTCVTNPSGTLVGMTPVAGNTYSWTPAAGLSSASSANPTANPTATTTYTLTATNTSSGCTATDQVLVTVNTALPTVNAGLDQTICQGVSTVLNASSNGTSLSWNNGVQNNISFVPSTVGTTTYTATATGSNGCAANDNVVVTVNPLPSAAVTTNGTSSFCPGSSVQLCAPTGTGYSYLWSGNLGTTQCVTISSSATTSVTVTNAFNCSATSAPQQVTVFNNPVASAGLDATITCVQNASGAQIGDVPNPTYTYSWTPATGLNSATIGNPIANPSTTTTYTLTVVNADGCMGSDQVTVTVNNTPPTANAGLDQSICLGASLVLQGSTNGASGTWNNGVTNGIPFTPSQTGTTSYTYSTVGANGCVNNDQVSVTVNALPVANAGQGAVITCVQNVNGVQLGANPISGNTYTWTPTSGLNNTNTANPIATPNATTTYTLLMSDANGCSDTAQVVVTVNNNPPIVAAGNDANVCNGDSFYLLANATAGSTVVWNGTIQNGSNILPTQSGYQVATATAANGCTADDSLLVTILQPTTSTLNEVACDEFVLNGDVYIQTGTYTQLLTNAAGCDSTITLNLTINLSPETPVVYVQNEVNLSTDVVPGQTYQWIYCSDLIPVPGATNPTFNPAANAIYAVVVTNNCGSDTSSCTTVSTIGLADHQQSEIAIYPNPNNGHFTILLPENNGSAKLEVLDLNGRIIFESILDELANELHLESLSSGTYWLRINQQVPLPVTKY